MLIPFRYGYMGGTSLSEEDAGDDIDDTSVREPMPQSIDYRPPEAFEPAEIVGDGNQELYQAFDPRNPVLPYVYDTHGPESGAHVPFDDQLMRIFRLAPRLKTSQQFRFYWDHCVGSDSSDAAKSR